ncbi:hypothetical protein PALB_24780 [Pseudoalteromonas luteoviolacea B = ATCC 29581]|nr:hypothetical protein PALB_24780 [Pseudoalteromonas luteoviolacea B = ATCC 29581]
MAKGLFFLGHYPFIPIDLNMLVVKHAFIRFIARALIATHVFTLITIINLE